MKFLLPKSEFGRNVLTLSLGTLIAQAIPIIVTPLLTHIYSPTEFGLFTLYITIIGILGSGASFRYELAIVMPKEEENSFNLAILSIVLSLITSLFFLFLVLTLKEKINSIMGENSVGNYIYLLPISMFLLSTYTTLTFWLNRQKCYSSMSKNRILQSITSNGMALILGALKFSINGLIIGHILAYTLTTFLTATAFLKGIKKNKISGKKIKKVLKEYKNHPKELFPAHFIGVIGMQLPIFFIGSHYGLAVAGLYALASRIVALPTLLVANAICDVYRQKASESYSKTSKFDDLFLATIKKSIKIAMIPCLLLFLISPYAFPLFLGSDWHLAGEYARILAVQTFINFIQNTVDAGAVIVKASKYILIWHLTRSLSYIILIYLAIDTHMSFIEYLTFQAIINSFFYFIDILNQYKFSKIAT